MESRSECGVQVSPGPNPEVGTTSFWFCWKIDFERIFRLRNPENPDFPIAMTLQNAPNPTHFYFSGIKIGEFSSKICDFH